MISKKHFGLVMGTWLMLALACTMAIVVQLINTGTVALVPSIVMATEAFVVNFIAGMLIPAARIGDSVSVRCGAKEGSFRFVALSTLITTVIFVTIVSLVMTVLAVGATPILLPAWLSVYPKVLAIGYVVALAFTPVAFKLTNILVEA